MHTGIQSRVVSQERIEELNPRSETRHDSAETKHREKKKDPRRTRADLRNCSARDDEIVPARTRRDSRQAVTAMTYDLEYLIL